MNTTELSAAPVKAFFDAFGKGDFQGILAAFHEDISITAVREAEQTGQTIYGSYTGIEGVKKFLSNLGNAFDTKAFAVQHIVGGEGIAFANGKFEHQVKQTGKLFKSDWALYVVVKDSKMVEYHFYEDSAKFEESNTK